MGAYIYITGGRNDEAFKDIRNSALNDIHLFDIEKVTWTTCVIFGHVPMSRWGHAITAHKQTLIMFGGKNLQKYAKNTVHFMQTRKSIDP